jgi:hypothetical protein
MTAPRADMTLAARLRLIADHVDGAGWPADVTTLRDAADVIETAAKLGDAPYLVCGICLYARTGEAEPAVTVIGGIAACEDHTAIVAQGEEWAARLRWARDNPR